MHKTSCNAAAKALGGSVSHLWRVIHREREPWAEALLLTTQLLVHGVSVADETLKATRKTLISDAVEVSFPPATPIGRKRGNEIAK